MSASRIQILVSDEFKTRFRQQANKRNMSESSYAAYLIEQVFIREGIQWPGMNAVYDPEFLAAFIHVAHDTASTDTQAEQTRSRLKHYAQQTLSSINGLFHKPPQLLM